MPTWIVDTTHVDTRLDVFLTETGVCGTRSAIQKALKKGKVTVNGEPTTVHRWLKEGDKIEWPTEDLVKRDAIRNQIMPEPRIVKETDDWIVIDKPCGLLTHPSSSSQEPTLVEWFLKHVPGASKVGEDPIRPGIVHRLDREVSGLLVIAKNQATFDALKQGFAQRTVEKRYLALVHGEILDEENDIKLAIARSTSKARMAARPKEQEGKAAWTHYKVRERFVGATLLDVEILSGRTHQIRAHFHGIGHPIIGDILYTRKQTDRNIKQPTRILLQSVHLSFTDPATGQRETFDLPADPAFSVMSTTLRTKG